jgi:hypothetical protein
VEHQRVAFDLVEIPTASPQNAVEGGVETVQDLLVLLRREKLGEKGVSGDIEKPDTDLSLLAVTGMPPTSRIASTSCRGR